MKIALLGYGKMGKCIEQLSTHHEIVGRLGRETSLPMIEKADVCIDFSHPDAVLNHVSLTAKAQKPIVIGTTGWNDQFGEVKRIVEKANIGLIWAPNFSIGVHLFLRIVSEAASLIDHFDNYEIIGYEHHHGKKVDSPSGTAKAIGERLLEKIQRKKKIAYEMINRPLSPDEIHFASLRGGSEPGKHTVQFDSPEDTITLTHQARNREGFARSALVAAEWIVNKKGIYTMEDLIKCMR